MHRREVLSEITSHLDNYIENCGQYWRHCFLSEFNSQAIVIDKECQGRIKQAVEKQLRPSNGVLNWSTSSASRIVPRHASDKYILHFDIKHYYESINFELVKKFLSGIFDKHELRFIEEFYFIDGGLRRGLFTSSIISEIVGIQIDNIVAKIIHENNWKKVIKYSRYYDDLIFSGLSLEELRKLEQDLTNELVSKGLEPNPKKTKILRNSSAKLLGLRIHDGKVMTPKYFRNKVRLRQHYAKTILDKLDTDSIVQTEEALMAVGSVIGSIRYIINNSEPQDARYILLLNKYCEIFEELSIINGNLRREENPLIAPVGPKAEKSAIKMINERRHKRQNADEKELAIIDDMVRKLKEINDQGRGFVCGKVE